MSQVATDLSVVLVVVGWQLGLVSPRCKLVLLVAVRRASPNLNVDIALVVAGHCLVVRRKHQQ